MKIELTKRRTCKENNFLRKKKDCAILQKNRRHREKKSLKEVNYKSDNIEKRTNRMILMIRK